MWISGIHGSKNWSVRTKKFSRPGTGPDADSAFFLEVRGVLVNIFPIINWIFSNVKAKNGYFTKVTGQKVDILDKATLVEKFQIYWIQKFIDLESGYFGEKSINSRKLEVENNVFDQNIHKIENWYIRSGFEITTKILIVHDSNLQINWYYTRKKII